MVCYICNYILIFRFCKYTNDYILFKKEKPILFKDDQSAIKRNLINIDRKLSQLPNVLSDELRIEINKINIDDLTWEDPIANQIISDESIIIKSLSSDQRTKFMEPADKMVSDLPEAIQNQYHEFITKYRKKQQEEFALSKILTHDKQWKEK